MFYKAKSINPLNYFQEAHITVRALSFMLSSMLIFFIFTTPTFAAGVEVVKAKNQAYIEASPQRLNQTVNEAVEILKTLENKQLNKEYKKELAKALKELRKEMKSEDAYADDIFKVMIKEIKAKKLPKVFEDRLLKKQEKYQDRKVKLEAVMANVISRYVDGEDITPYDNDDINLTRYQNYKGQKFDPNNLPFEIRKNKQIKPKTTKEQFISKGLLNQPLPHYAALGDFDYSTLAGASNTEYLAPSDEIEITQTIQDKAAELDYDPVQIYNFVRNNIEFVPTWGAVQSAELTLGAKRGNAMDISSLLIALLRASKIPARYVHGTIELPVEEVKNWFGGFENINSALTFAYSNGLPAMTITGGGQVDAVRMEHIWVEAATDYFPSRGAKNLKADSWIPLDSSYKQYEFSEGMDALSASGVDINTTLQSFINSADINETEGSVANMDSAIIEDMLAQAQTNLEANITSQIVDNNQTLLDVIGGKQIIEEYFTTLPSSIHGKLLVIGARYAKTPVSLQQKVTYYLEPLTQEAAIDEMFNGRKTVTLPYAKVNNQKVTLSYAPASQADQDALESLLPTGEITDASQLPSNLPSYIHVKPQVKLNGTVILEGLEMSLGDKLNIDQAVFPVNVQSMGYKKHKSHAGDYLALGTVAQSISPLALQKLQNRMNEVKTILESQDQAQIATLDREDVMGNMHYATMLGYYAQLLGQTKMLQQTSKVHEILIGYGTFGSEVGINDRFGLPVGIKAGGIGLDIPMTKVVVADNNNQENFKNYRLQAGMIASSLEHQTPEQMYNTDSQNPVQGISTMKAFALANAQGQKIYTITQDNINEVLPKIQASSLTKGDIIGSVNAGKTVTVHEREVSVPGWTGTGYMVIDPVNGDGAFMISGGGNGGWYEWVDVKIASFLSLLGRLGPLSAKLLNTLGTFVKFFDMLSNCKGGLSLAIGMLLIAFFAQFSIMLVLLTTLAFSSLFLSSTIFIALAAIGWGLSRELEKYCD